MMIRMFNELKEELEVDIQKQGNESQENRYITEEDTETTK
jgi:hypothetical protein